VAGSGEEIARRAFEAMNRSESADAVMAELEELMDPEIEWVNPEDGIESGTRKGLAGMRTALENFYEGAGRRGDVGAPGRRGAR
jgi:ketosteroid isomerase-like protein